MHISQTLIATIAACAIASRLQAQVRITEIMFDPIKGLGCEYVELFNATSTAVSLRGWRIVDGSGKTQATLPRAAVVDAQAFVVLAADSLVLVQFPWLRDSSNVIVLNRSSLGLNASGDAVVVVDRAGVTVDSTWFDDDWHRPDLDARDGTSLERASLSAPSTSADNWSTSAGRNGGTPGAVNSIALPVRVSEAQITIDPLTVSPDGDGIDDVTRISYRLPARTARIMMTLHDRHGRLLERLVNNELVASAGEYIWNGYDRHGMPRAPGIYVVRIEAYDAGGTGIVSARSGVIVARR